MEASVTQKAHPTGGGIGALVPSWREAAVFGALWGAGEITIGAFLHATRIPLSGVLLAFAGVALLTAAQMMISRPWFPLRVALVCAALRSLSPEGLMPGPMAAIILQGFLVSAAFRVFRHPLAAGMSAGFLATFLSQVQSFLVKMVAYGTNLWQLLVRLLEQAESLLNLLPGYGWFAVAVYLALVGAIGAGAGVFGWHLGRRALSLREGSRVQAG